MATPVPTSLTLNQKKRIWKQHKAEQFVEISKDDVSKFNYFLRNNDIFKFIAPEDHLLAAAIAKNLQNKEANFFFGTIVGVFAIDMMLKVFAPRIRFPKYRAVIFASKYLLLPCISFTICKQIFEIQEALMLQSILKKYQFGFEDYKRANRIFERALEVNRLEQLLQKRSNFDWTGIPEFE